MALPPTVPTSFVPKQPVATTRRARSGGNLFMTLALFVAGIAVVVAGGVFGYEKYLENSRNRKAAELKAAEQSISRSTVEEFIRLRDRFTSTETLLSQHISISQFFDLLERMTVANVQFESLKVSVLDDRTATLSMTGTARSFNSLAVESAAFAAEKRIRRAIFSGISANEKGMVTFTLEAELSPELVTWDGPDAPVAPTPAVEPIVTPPPAATTTP